MMGRTLDRARPYGEVHGGGARTYEQDGLSFDVKGTLLSDEPAGEAPSAAKFWLVGDEPDALNLDVMPTAELMALVEQYGGEFTTRDAAVAFIRGQ